MFLALRKSAPSSATFWQRFTCAIIKARLVSRYCHGGIVIDGALYHATASHGVHMVPPGDWSPHNWDLINIGGDDSAALQWFHTHDGARYDWLSLLTFVGLRASDKSRFYCFEFGWGMATQSYPDGRVTPEDWLWLAAQSNFKPHLQD